MHRKHHWLMPLFAFSLAALPGCGSDDADADSNGACTVTDVGDGNSAIRCPDGTELVVKNGKDGDKGDKGDQGDKGDTGDKGDKGGEADAPCTLGQNAEGKHTLTCGSDTVVIGDDCEDGYHGGINLYRADQGESRSFTLFQVTNCTWIRGNVDIDGFDGEELPKALARIEKIDGYLDIYDNDSLESVAFPALKEIGDGLYIGDNPSLETASFPSLQMVADDFSIINNDSLLDVDGFPALVSVGEWLSIGENPSLERIGNFAALKSVGGIQLWQNHALESIADFPALETIEGFGGGPSASYPLLFIDGHDALTSIGGFGQVTSIDGHVTISNNPELEQSDIDALLEDIDISGTTKTCNNKGGDSC